MLQSKIENKVFENLPNKILLQNVHVIDKSEKLDKKCNIEIVDGKISQLLENVPENYNADIVDFFRHTDGVQGIKKWGFRPPYPIVRITAWF